LKGGVGLAGNAEGLENMIFLFDTKGNNIIVTYL